MPPRRTLVLSLDGLSIRDLGAYGNTWIPTPAFDRLAARATLFEHVIADSLDPKTTLKSVWNADATSDSSGSGWLDSVVRRGCTPALITDSADVFAGQGAADFDRQLFVEPTIATEPAADWDQTHCAVFFAELLQLLQDLPDHHLVFSHYGGLTRCWDAPGDWRNKFWEEGDPEPSADTNPPVGRWAERDPDECVRLYHAIAAEIMVLDCCLGAFWETLQADPHFRMILMSPRGYPLGEHAVVGWNSPILYSEATAVPLLIVDPATPVGWRVQRVVQPMIAGDWLRQWFADDPVDQALTDETKFLPQLIQPARCSTANARAVRTPEWFLIQSGDKRELYAKPDDRWEFNDVSSRCPAIVEELELLLEAPSETSRVIQANPDSDD